VPHPPRRCLTESTTSADAAAPLYLRAARAYLDICFFHPVGEGYAHSVLARYIKAHHAESWRRAGLVGEG
jgi:hypothetical protein